MQSLVLGRWLHNLGVNLSEILTKFHSMHIKSLCVNTHTEKAANCTAGEATMATQAGRYKTWNGMKPEVVVAKYRCGCVTRGQKFALIRTVCLRVWTLISHSVTATKTGQAPTDSHVKRMELQR